MATYTNPQGDRITVSDEHIDTAIRLKEELQKASPSRRTSWAQHKRLMEEEGFDDSSTNENYRKLINNEQKRRGTLPTAPVHANHVADGKLASIRQLIGELAIEKRDNQNVLRELNKVKRGLTDELLAFEGIEAELDRLDFSHLTGIPAVESVNRERSLLVLPSDWHIGTLNRDFNHEVAMRRIGQYIQGVIGYTKLFGIDRIYVAHMGDIAENAYMHQNTQANEIEFSFSKQIVRAADLLFFLVTELSRHAHVTYLGTVEGNHGRMSEKGKTLVNDSAEYIVNEMVVRFIVKTQNLHNVTIDLSGYREDSILYAVHGRTFKVVHGDHEGQQLGNIIQKHISFENRLIDFMAMGHFHNFQVKTENFGRKIYGSGCLQGTTSYAKKLKLATTPSQGIVVVSEDEFLPIDIPLD